MIWFLSRIAKGVTFFLTLVLLLLPIFTTRVNQVAAQTNFNQQINYQGKLVNASSSAVANTGYSMTFKLYTVATSGAAIWTETRTATTSSGLFSVMLGSVSSLASVNFNQTLYLGVTVGGDGEMTPRKILGTVPSAFEAKNSQTVGGVASTSLIRNDQVGTISTTSASSILTVIQNGAGKILSLFSAAVEVFTVASNGNVGVGSTTPGYKLGVAGSGFFGGDLVATGTLAVTGTTTLGTSTITSLNLTNALAITSGGTGAVTALAARTNLGATTVGANMFTLVNPSAQTFLRINADNTVSAVATSTLGVALSDTTGVLAGTRGGTGLSTVTQNQLLIGGAGNAWSQLATSSLGVALTDTSGTLSAIRGGTGLVSYATGDLIYASGANTLANRTIGSTGNILSVVGGVPSWVATSTLGLLSAAVTGIGPAGSIQTGATITLATSTSAGPSGLTTGLLVTATGNTITYQPTLTGTLNNAGLTNSTISLATGSSGSDINWGAASVALGATATLNIPSASAVNRGLLSAADWLTFNTKVSSTSLDTSAKLAALLSDETGSAGGGLAVFSNGPTFTGTSIFANASTSGNFTVLATTTLATTTMTGTTILSNQYINNDGTVAVGLNFDSNNLPSFTRSSGSPLVFSLRNTSSNINSGFNLEFTSGPTFVTHSKISAVIEGASSDSYMSFFTRGSAVTSERMRISSNGNIGIGTTSSSSLLTVAGTVTVTGTSTFGTTTVNSLTLTQALALASGGTGFTTYAAGDFLYASGVNTLAKRTIGTTGDVLSVVGGVPTWVATSTLGFSGATFTTSAQLAALLSDETGSAGGGLAVFSNSPTFTGLSSFASTTASGGYYIGELTAITGSTTARNFFMAGASSTTFTSGTDNNGIGRNVFNNLTTGSHNIATGDGALRYLTSGSRNVGFGRQALQGSSTGFMTGSDNNAIGFSALQKNATGAYNNALGYLTLNSNSSGSYNNAFGYFALVANTIGSYNNAFGNNTLRFNVAGSYNNAIGEGALYFGTEGSYNNAIGYNTLWANVGTGTIAIGYQTADNALTVDRGIFIGYNIDAMSNSADDVLNIGNIIFGTGVDGTGTTLSSGNIGIGTSTPDAKLTVFGGINISSTTQGYALAGNRVLSTIGTSTVVGALAGSAVATGYGITAVGYSALMANTTGEGNSALGSYAARFTTTGNNNAAFGNYALYNNTTGSRNLAVGTESLLTSTSSNDNVAIGHEALFYNTGAGQNVAVGNFSQFNTSTGTRNSSLGYYSLNANTTGSDATAAGYMALRLNTTGSFNTAFGNSALYSNTTGGFNTALGYQAGYDINGATSTGYNTIVGFNTGRGITTGANNTILGANVSGLSPTLTNTVIIADGSGNQRLYVDSIGNLGVGTTTPGSRLTVGGDAYIAGNLTATGTLAISGITTLSTTALTAALRDSSNSAGTLGMVLQSTATSTRWVATSTLGVGNGRFTGLTDTISSFTNGRVLYESASAVIDSAGFTFLGNQLTTPTLGVTGTSSFASTLTLSGTAANVAMGINYLSYDGTDTGLTVDVSNRFSLFSSEQFDPTDVSIGDSLSLQTTAATTGIDVYGSGLVFNKINSGRRGAAIVPVQTTSDVDQMGLAFFTHGSVTTSDIVNERMRITASGFVGIGSTTPGYMLSVAGTARVTGDANFDGSLIVGVNATELVTAAAGDLVVGGTSNGFQYDASAGNWYARATGNAAAGMQFIAQRGRGADAALPTTITTGDDVLLLRGLALSATTTTTFTESSRITFDTEGTIGNDIVPGLLRFYTANSAGTLTERLTIDSEGVSTFIASSTAGNGQLALRSARVAVVTDNLLGGMNFLTADTNLGVEGSTTAAIRAYASQTQTASAFGSYLSFFTTPNSTITPVEAVRIDQSGSVSIGTSTPNAKLTVHGDINISDTGQGYEIGGNQVLYASSTNRATLVGIGAGSGNAAALFNTAIGYQALNIASSTENTAVGYYALRSAVGGANTAVGASALNFVKGISNSAFGANAFSGLTSGDINIAIGDRAASGLGAAVQGIFIGANMSETSLGGLGNVIIGYNSAQYLSNATTTGYNTIIGTNNVFTMTGGVNNTIIGANITTAGVTSNNIIIADGAGNRRINVDSTGRTGIGTSTQTSLLTVASSTAIATSQLFSVATTTTLFTILGNGNVGIGSTTPSSLLSVAGTLMVTATSTMGSILPFGPFTNNISDFSLGGQTARWNQVWADTFNIGTSTWSIKTNTANRLGFFNTFNGGGTEALSITTTGNMGVGTTAPAFRLSVVDSQATTYVARILNSNTTNTADGLLISLGVANASRGNGNYFIGFSDAAGTVAGKIQGGTSTAAVIYTTAAADLAEYFSVDRSRTMPQPGEIVTLDPNNDRGVMRAESGVTPFGIVATNPGFLGNGPICKARDNNCDTDYAKDNAIISLSGQVPVRVNLEGGPIKIGDNITLSSVTGVGKKATESGETVVGIALAEYTSDSGDGTIMVYVVNKDHQSIADALRQKLFTIDLNSSSTVFSTLLADATDTIWNRMVTLVQGFKDGVLTLTGFKADNMEANTVKTEELCVGTTCISEGELKEIIEQKNAASSGSTGGSSSGGESGGGTPDPAPAPTPTPDPVPTPEPEPEPESVGGGETTPDPVPPPADVPTPGA